MSHLARAQLLIERSRYEEAIGELQQHLAQEPNNPLVHSYLGLCLCEMKRYADATQEAQLGVHLGPDQPFSHYALAEVLYARKRFKEALPAAQEALRLDPREPRTFGLISRIHFAQSRWQASLDAATEGLAFDPEDVVCSNLRAMSLVKLGRRTEAGATIDTALARNPEVALTHANQGWTMLERGQPQKAMEHFREALRIDPELEWARMGIVEAMKARHGIYRWMLVWFFWMSRLPPRTQWGVVIGGYLGFQFLRQAEQDHPEWSVWITPLTVAYIVFALMTWIADPLFNLLLRLNRFGRLALSREQLVASNWLACCLVPAAIALIAYLATGNDEAQRAAITFGLLCIPVSAIYRCDSGRPRTIMAWYTIALAAVGGVALIPWQVLPDLMGLLLSLLVVPCMGLFLLGAIAAPWVSSILISIKTRH